MEPLRSWLEVRGEAGLRAGADVLAFDAAGALPTREQIAGLAVEARFAVRLSPVYGPEIEADLDAAMSVSPWAVILPGCRGRADVQQLGAKLAVREARLGLPAGSIRIVAIAADNAPGVIGLPSLAQAGLRLVALATDARALRAALGGRAAPGAVAHARALTAIVAAAAGIAAIDGAFEGPFDAAAARAEAGAARDEGFCGKIAKRPEEVAIYNEIFATAG